MDPVALFPVFLVLIFTATAVSLSVLSGWRQAAARWPAPKGLSARYCRSARVNLVRMNHVLSIGVLPQGLHLKLWGVFRLGAGNILVPWEDVELVQRNAGLWGPITRVDVKGWGHILGPEWILGAWEELSSPGPKA